MGVMALSKSLPYWVWIDQIVIGNYDPFSTQIMFMAGHLCYSNAFQVLFVCHIVTHFLVLFTLLKAEG